MTREMQCQQATQGLKEGFLQKVIGEVRTYSEIAIGTGPFGQSISNFMKKVVFAALFANGWASDGRLGDFLLELDRHDGRRENTRIFTAPEMELCSVAVMRTSGGYVV